MALKLLFLGTHDDDNYLYNLKSLVAGHQVFINLLNPSTWTEVKMYCSKRGITGIISTNPSLLKKVSFCEDASIDNYAGSLFKRDGIEVLFIDPLKQLQTVKYGKFLAERYISKLLIPSKWEKIPATEFDWEELTASNESAAFDNLNVAIAIAVDIETRPDLSISMISYTGIYCVDGIFRTKTYVLLINDNYNLAIMRKFNKELRPPKIFQNGKYDNAYLLAYNAPIYNWLWDTANMFHCWYSELPKDLGSLAAFFIRECIYWKDLAQSNDLYEQMKYNGRDTWGTANVFIQWIYQAPDFAIENYKMEFPLVYPCLLSEMTGIKRNMERLEQARTASKNKIAEMSASLDKMLGVKNFNVNSPKQMRQLLDGLGCKDIKSTEEKMLRKAMYRHPLINLVLDKVLAIRGHRKMISTYLRTDEDITKTSKNGAKEYKGRVLYSLSPHATDTGRLASKEHAFWCGVNIQNQPSRPTEYLTGKEVKSTLEADDGFLWGEVDLEQAESRDTAYISGEKPLIAAVTGIRDFHSVNASSFFGKLYEDIYDDGIKKTKDKKLRDLAKRVNHGANYVMGPDVLVDTMGLKAIYEAAHMLGLPKMLTPKEIATHLLESFHRTYPGLQGVFYPWVKHQVITTHMLTGATGWTRYCFGKPDKNKRDLNAYVAHCAQSLNAMVLNKAYMKVFYDIAINPAYSSDFKLIAQIHDSILFQFREGKEFLCDLVRRCMEIPVTVKSTAGEVYTFTVPAAVKAGKEGKGVKFWSETE